MIHPAARICIHCSTIPVTGSCLFTTGSDSGGFSKAIEDNSYFIEEAYNQEDRVVQHINNGRYSLLSSHDFAYTFTQEWPVFSQKHQFSYTIGFSSLNSGSVFGFNDVILNYRYQLTGHDAFITLAPRISLIIPTGNAKKDLGTGVFGYQFNLPASKRISNSFVLPCQCRIHASAQCGIIRVADNNV